MQWGWGWEMKLLFQMWEGGGVWKGLPGGTADEQRSDAAPSGKTMGERNGKCTGCEEEGGAWRCPAGLELRELEEWSPRGGEAAQLINYRVL